MPKLPSIFWGNYEDVLTSTIVTRNSFIHKFRQHVMSEESFFILGLLESERYFIIFFFFFKGNYYFMFLTSKYDSVTVIWFWHVYIIFVKFFEWNLSSNTLYLLRWKFNFCVCNLFIMFKAIYESYLA